MREEEEESLSYPAHSHHVITDKHSAHKLGLDPLPQQDLLKVREPWLINEHGLMTGSLRIQMHTHTHPSCVLYYTGTQSSTWPLIEEAASELVKTIPQI